MEYQIQKNMFEDVQLMRVFIAGASNGPFDMRMDRINALYHHLRHAGLSKKWPSMAGLRTFLEETSDENPYVPHMIRAAYHKSKAIPAAPRRFIEQWKEEMGAIETLPINPEDFIAVIDALPPVRDAFAANNRHDSDYYFSKYAEWYVSLHYARQMKARTLVDVGAAYDGFARTLTSLMGDTHVTMLDLAFKKGLHKRSERIACLGADAADMSAIATNSVDLVCMHNAFEHFAGDSDMGCLREAERILRPGGKVLITPFFFAHRHSITVNPAACFLFEEQGELPQKVCEELRWADARLDYNHRILSPYARRYDLGSTRQRILNSVPQLSARLLTCAFEPKPRQDFTSAHLSGIACRPDLFEHTLFHYLELSKP